MPVHMDKIEEFLKTVEGPQQVTGYIPCWIVGQFRKDGSQASANYKGDKVPALYKPMGISGVTIATGVDLGQTDITTLRDYELSPEIIQQLEPYLGKQGSKACTVLHKKPLRVTRAAAEAIDRVIHLYHLNMIMDKFDDDAGGFGAFENLPWQAQAAIFSLLYQRGVNSPKHFPSIWSDLLDGYFSAAGKAFFEPANWNGYMPRRKAEGALLMELA